VEALIADLDNQCHGTQIAAFATGTPEWGESSHPGQDGVMAGLPQHSSQFVAERPWTATALPN
jgi:hypothetical protein